MLRVHVAREVTSAAFCGALGFMHLNRSERCSRRDVLFSDLTVVGGKTLHGGRPCCFLDRGPWNVILAPKSSVCSPFGNGRVFFCSTTS